MDEPRNDHGLPESVLSLLRSAGWAPGRSIGVEAYVDAFSVEHIPLNIEAIEFLREFGELIIQYTTSCEGKDVLDFCARRAVQGIGRGGLEDFEELSGRTRLCPIGHYQFGTCLLFMDDVGEVLGGTDETITFIGTTGKNAIGNILTGIEPQVVGRFPSFEESFSATTIPLDRASRDAFGAMTSWAAEAHRGGSLYEFDVVISSFLERHGFTRVPQKKSISWTHQAAHAQGQANVIFKLVERAPIAVQFGVRRTFLENRGRTENAIRGETFRVNAIEFVGPIVTRDQNGLEVILRFLDQLFR